MSLNRIIIAAIGIACAAAASAEITLSQLIVELTPGAKARDVEIYNPSEERAYVLIEPRQILEPGQSSEHSASPADPEQLGLLVSPRKLILEPNQRRLIRIADIRSDTTTERVYRVTVKPQVGEIIGDKSGLKLLIGYDMLVIARPARPQPANLEARRVGSTIEITNRGNSSVELENGKQCRSAKVDCMDLGGKRLYAGATWTVTLPYRQVPVEFKVRQSDGWTVKTF